MCCCITFVFDINTIHIVLTTVAKFKLGWRVHPQATALDVSCANVARII